MAALKAVDSYLTNRKQRTKINSAFSSCEATLFEVWHGSILGPLLFNIFLCDLFIIMNKTALARYTVGNKTCVEPNNIDVVPKSLEKDSIKLL